MSKFKIENYLEGLEAEKSYAAKTLRMQIDVARDALDRIEHALDKGRLHVVHSLVWVSLLETLGQYNAFCYALESCQDRSK